MRNVHIQLALFLSSIVFLCGGITRSAASTERILLGVSPEDENFYKGLLSSSSPVKCKDGSKKFNKSQFNDDFCDCPDASDEPGTSACPSGKFYCRNSGHIPLSVYSSRVNDGICDCCDGSDEYDGKIKCPNTCWEAGEVARDKLKKKIVTYQQGVTLRRQEIEKAKTSIAKDEADLAKFKVEEKILNGLVQQLKDRKEQIEKAEEKERLQREKEEKERKEAEENNQKEQYAGEKTEVSGGKAERNDNHDIVGLVEDSHTQQDVVDVSEDEVKNNDHVKEEEFPNSVVEPVEEEFSQHASKQGNEGTIDDTAGGDHGNQEVEVSENADSLSREELGRLVASRWTGEKTQQHTENSEDVGSAKANNDAKHEMTSKDNFEEEYNGYESEENDNRYDEDDDDVEDDAEDHIEDFKSEDLDDSSSYKSELDDELDLSDITSSEPSWLKKIQNTVRSMFQAVNLFQTPVNKSEAAQVRKEYEESSAKLTKLQSKISSLTQKLKHDFGPEKEFYSFYGQCFESKQNKYVYKICPYKEASQVEGYRSTQLGSWEKFEDSYKFMQFSNGEKCWNGPDRSLKVKLRCGLNNEVTDVDEPSRCEYVSLLSTPALCKEEKLKELQDKLESVNQKQPKSSHDEL